MEYVRFGSTGLKVSRLCLGTMIYGIICFGLFFSFVGTVLGGLWADGSWGRMKLCGNPDCLWAFYDRSHSRRGAWCEMASCGNKLKNRNLRARRAQAS